MVGLVIRKLLGPEGLTLGYCHCPPFVLLVGKFSFNCLIDFFNSKFAVGLWCSFWNVMHMVGKCIDLAFGMDVCEPQFDWGEMCCLVCVGHKG